MQAFMQSENRGTDGVPAKQIPSLDRLMGGRYVDARGKV